MVPLSPPQRDCLGCNGYDWKQRHSSMESAPLELILRLFIATAIAEGRRTAASVDRYLMGRRVLY